MKESGPDKTVKGILFSSQALRQDHLSKQFLLIAEGARNRINHTPVLRSEDDCPHRTAFLAELAEKRKKNQGVRL